MLASEVRKGSAEVLVLGALEGRARHGYEIARWIEDQSGGAIEFNTATLYPTLHKLERRGDFLTIEMIAAFVQMALDAEHEQAAPLGAVQNS